MRAKVGAVMLSAMTNSAKDLDAKEGMATNAAAFQLVALLGKKGQLDAAKKLAAELPKKAPPGGKSTASWYEHITLAELMDHLRPKDKGGDGMHPDLQSNIRLKGALNSIEEKLRAPDDEGVGSNRDEEGGERAGVDGLSHCSARVIDLLLCSTQGGQERPGGMAETFAANARSMCDLRERRQKGGRSGALQGKQRFELDLHAVSYGVSKLSGYASRHF